MHACWLVTGGEGGILSQWMTTWRLRKTRIKAGAVVCVSKKTTPISKCKSSSELVSESTQESRQKVWLIRFQLKKPLCSKISQARLRKKFTTSRSRGESKRFPSWFHHQKILLVIYTSYLSKVNFLYFLQTKTYFFENLLGDE
jgi:hypothetical protein